MEENLEYLIEKELNSILVSGQQACFDTPIATGKRHTLTGIFLEAKEEVIVITSRGEDIPLSEIDYHLQQAIWNRLNVDAFSLLFL